MNSVREGLVVILPRNAELVDVFTGTGWNNHTLFAIKDKPVKVKGPDIGDGPYNFLVRTLNRKVAA